MALFSSWGAFLILLGEGSRLVARTLGHLRGTDTANFLMVVSPAVLAYDVSARASDVLMGIAVFPIGQIYSGPFEKLRDG